MRFCNMIFSSLSFNTKGFSFPEVLVSVAIMSMLGMGAASLSGLTTQSTAQLRTTRLVISARTRIEAALKNPVAWRNTIAKNSTFNCTTTSPGCVLSTASGGYYDFVLYDALNNEKITYDPSDATTRLSINGGSCPIGTPEPSANCPLKYQAQWRPACITPCLQPTIEVKVSLIIDVPSNVYSLNAKNYEFSSVRGMMEDTIQSACQTLNGIYNATTRTCRPKYAGKTCAALGLPYQIVTNVHSDGNIDCSPFYKGQCSSSELMTGISSSGQAICSPKSSVCVPNIDCEGSWSSCSAACGPGTQTFTVTTAASGIGATCETYNGDARACMNAPCPTTTTLPAALPVNCQGSWGACSASCGLGMQTFVITVPAKNGGAACVAANGATQFCSYGACPPPPPTPVDCVGSWGACSRTCGGGTQTYSITTTAKNGGNSCPYSNGSSRACNSQACPPAPVNCVGSWSGCSASCGGGTRTFNISVYAANGGSNCWYNDGDLQTCNAQPCPPPATPINCSGSWGSCDPSTGLQYFSISQSPMFGGTSCPVSPRSCPVNCIGSWGSCNSGSKTYTISQYSMNGGASCPYANGATDSSGCAPPPTVPPPTLPPTTVPPPTTTTTTTIARNPRCEFVSDSASVGYFVVIPVGGGKTVDLNAYEKGGMDCYGVDGASCSFRMYAPNSWSGTFYCR